jgi:hypothetical protein
MELGGVVIMNMVRVAYESDNPVKTLTALLEPYDENTALLGKAFSMYSDDGGDGGGSECDAKGWFIFCATTMCHLYYVEKSRFLCPRSSPVFYTLFPSSSIPYAWLTCDNMGMLRIVQKQHRMSCCHRITVIVCRKLGQYELSPLQLEDFFGCGNENRLGSTVTIQVIDDRDMYVVQSSPPETETEPLPFMLLFTVTTRHIMVRLTLISGTLVEDVPENNIKYVSSPVYGE